MKLILILALALPLVAQQYNFSAPTWADRQTGKATLYYCIVQPAPPDAEPQIEAALQEWSRYIQVTFTRGACYADRTLTFSWVSDDHAPGCRFPGRQMAHARFPPQIHPEPEAGDVHFRASEDWTPALEIYTVALHEIGHALGVWDVRGGVMDDSSWWRHLTLQTGDIIEIRKHYAPRCYQIECAMRYTP
jgi:predicted Zn-dependent protease